MNLKLGFTPGRFLVHEHQAPWKVVRAFHSPGGESLVHLHNVSGGILGGDSLALTMDVGAAAQVQVTSTSATRVYRARDGALPAQLRTHVTVAGGALLEYLPDPVIPFAGSRFEQRTSITLHESAGLFWWETISCGREAAGERFQFESLFSHTEIRSGRQLIAVEHWRLEPGRGSASSLVRMGPFLYSTVFYLCHPKGVSLEGALVKMAHELSTVETRWGASALVANGCVVRGLSMQSRFLAAGLISFWSMAKETLYGREAILPRKMY